MAHNIEYFNKSEADCRDRKKVKAELDSYVAHRDWQEGCSGLYHEIRWIEGPICDSDIDAEEFLKEHDKGDYDNLAVRYRVPKKPSEKYVSIRADLIAARKKLDKEVGSMYQFANVKMVGCKRCLSKINREHLRTNRCPVCGMDLRPKSELDRIERMRKKVDSIEEKLAKQGRIDAKNGDIRWLIKIEYHT